MSYFITAIGTDSGKTVVSAIICEALHADYWKPVQAGTPTDSETVRNLISNTSTVIHSEKFILKTPASPHAAAKIDGVRIRVDDFILPASNRPIIVEGAGGCLVPLNDTAFVIDLASHLNLEVILVANLYLGSINHTLLTLESLRSRNLRIRGLIFNGEANAESQRIILQHANLPQLLHIGKESLITKEVISKYASILKQELK